MHLDRASCGGTTKQTLLDGATGTMKKYPVTLQHLSGASMHRLHVLTIELLEYRYQMAPKVLGCQGKKNGSSV